MTKDEMVNAATLEIKDTSARAQSIILQGINEGLTLFRSKLKRYWALETRKFSLTQNAAIYQAPEDMIRGDAIYFNNGTERVPLTEMKNVDEWDNLIRQTITGYPQSFRWISNDLFEIYPAPDANYLTANGAGGEIRYLRRAKPLSQSDYTTGTVAVTNGSNAVVGTGTTWSTGMVGRFLRLGDGSDDMNYYRIIAVADATHLTVENNFDGSTQSGKTYLIGEQPNIPQEYHFALISKGLHRYFRARRDRGQAKDYLDDFNMIMVQASGEYTGADTSAVIESNLRRPRFTGRFPNRLS
jgi:hypothetical protein